MRASQATRATAPVPCAARAARASWLSPRRNAAHVVGVCRTCGSGAAPAQAGGFVVWGRVNANLNISRALGDASFKQVRSNSPASLAPCCPALPLLCCSLAVACRFPSSLPFVVTLPCTSGYVALRLGATGGAGGPSSGGAKRLPRAAARVSRRPSLRERPARDARAAAQLACGHGRARKPPRLCGTWAGRSARRKAAAARSPAALGLGAFAQIARVLPAGVP
jgi:hypothetical protein